MTITHINDKVLELTKEVTRLRGELNAERLFSKQAMASVLEIAAQRDAARAELAALQNQEAVGYFMKDGDRLVEVANCVNRYPGVMPLYAAAGAKEKTE